MTNRKWGFENLVNTTVAGSQTDPVITTLTDGGYVIAWHDTGGASDVVRFQIFDADGGRRGDEGLVVGFGSDQAQQPSITASDDGGFVIVFERDRNASDSDPVFQGFDAEGNSIFGPFTISSSFDEASQPSIAALGSGEFVAVWTNPSTSDIEGRVVTSGNVNISATFVVNTTTAGAQADPDVVRLSNGNFVVVWEDNEGAGAVRGRVFDSSGVAVSVNDFQITSGTSGIGNATPKVTALANGGFVVTYADDTTSFPDVGSGIRARIHAPDGTPFGSEFIVASNLAGDEFNTDVTSLPTGGFFIAWVDLNTGTIRGQTFDILGNRVGTETIINTQTNINTGNDSVAVTALGDGRVVVTWQNGSSSVDGSGDGILSQIIDTRNGVVFGGGGNDLLYGNFTDDEINGLEGDDMLFGLAGRDNLFGGGGDDTLEGGAGADILIGGLGAFSQDIAAYTTSFEAVSVNLITRVVSGGHADGDILFGIDGATGSNFADTLIGNGGGNELNGGIGADTIDGMFGADLINGGIGNDVINGGNGADTLNGDATNDTIDGGFDNDLINGGNGNDVLRGGGQVDTLNGGNDNDQLFGDAGNDFLDGGGQADTLFGGLNNDTLLGGLGNDQLFGEGQNDSLNGGLNNDTLDGGLGNDMLTGGGQIDTFIFRPGNDQDVITDFQNNLDVIDLTAFGFSSLSDAFAGSLQLGADFVFNFGAGDVLQVSNATMIQLQDDILL